MIGVLAEPTKTAVAIHTKQTSDLSGFVTVINGQLTTTLARCPANSAKVILHGKHLVVLSESDSESPKQVVMPVALLNSQLVVPLAVIFPATFRPFRLSLELACVLTGMLFVLLIPGTLPDVDTDLAFLGALAVLSPTELADRLFLIALTTDLNIWHYFDNSLLVY